MNVNPALATASTYNCKGHTLLEHIVVYWIGPCLGVLASIALFNHVLDEYSAGEKVKDIDEAGDHIMKNGVTPVSNGIHAVGNGVKSPGKKGTKSKKTTKGKKSRRRGGGKVSSG